MVFDPTDTFDLRQELLAAFEGEYREHLQAMRAVLDAGAVSGTALRDVFRRAHSLKGAARAVDLPRIELIAHELETLLFAAVEAAQALPPDDVQAVRRGLDSIEHGMRGEPDPPDDAALPDAAAGALPAAVPLPSATVAPASAPDAASRVSSVEIERLLDSVQAASDAMLGQGQGRQWLADHAAALGQLLASSDAAGADMVEIRNGLRALARSVGTRLREGRHEDWQREQTVSALRAQVERVALVSADSVFGPLAAMARALGREQGQEIVVRFDGMALLADRAVLQGLRDPVIQLLRNAVGHGLGGRPQGDGAAPGPEPEPSVSLSVAIRSGRLLVEVGDNGAGPDLEAIADRARERGLLPDGASPPDEAALLALVFEPGFSTARTVDRLSGRGMGLSIVAEAAARLGGRASMAPIRDGRGRVCGTVLRMSVPLAARRQTLLLVEAGGHVLALPSDSVARLRSVPWPAITRDTGGWTARIEDDRTLPVWTLASLLGLTAGKQNEDQAQLVVLRGAGGDTGLVVDRLLSVATLLVRPPSIVGLDRRLVGGVAVPDDNRPVLVLEPDALRDACSRVGVGTDGIVSADRAEAATGSRTTRRRPTILVVDDSITTRTLEKTILQAQGYTVLIAVDGLEALDVLRAGKQIDIVVADVEMPRLDGFGLVAAMQADPHLKPVPIVLMTSRNDEADIRRGLDLGASAYLTKQEFEQGALLTVIGQLLP